MQPTKILQTLIALFLFHCSNAQTTAVFADSIRKRYKIPELGYAVVSANEVIELAVIGTKKIDTPIAAALTDRFRIGSNTKAITGFIAAQLVRQKKIRWNTKFFDLFPELKAQSNRAYRQLTLLDLLTFRTRLYPYTYTYDEPAQADFTGDGTQQRYQFTAWFFRHEPVRGKGRFHPSNLGYIAAGEMLEKASGKTYKALVADLGRQLGIRFDFGNPNTNDNLQPFGHDKDLHPEPLGENYKLDWLLPAGNINVSLPDYAKFIQLQLKGFAGQSDLLDAEEFNFLHFGLDKFSVGWFRGEENGRIFSYNIGNPGTFLSKVFVFKDSGRAFVLFANAQTPEADAGLDVVYAELRRKYDSYAK